MLQHHHPFSFQSFSCWCWGVFIAWSAKVRTLFCLRWCTLRQPWEGESSGPPATAFTGIMCDMYNVWKYMEMRCTSNSKFCTFHLHYHKYVFCICSVLSLILTKVYTSKIQTIWNLHEFNRHWYESYCSDHVRTHIYIYTSSLQYSQLKPFQLLLWPFEGFWVVMARPAGSIEKLTCIGWDVRRLVP